MTIAIRTIEGCAEIPEELRPVSLNTRSYTIKHAQWQAARIDTRLHHERRYSTDQHDLRNTPGAMPPDVPHHLTATGGMSDMDGLSQVKHLGQGSKIIRVGVHVIAGPRLA